MFINLYFGIRHGHTRTTFLFRVMAIGDQYMYHVTLDTLLRDLILHACTCLDRLFDPHRKSLQLVRRRRIDARGIDFIIFT